MNRKPIFYWLTTKYVTKLLVHWIVFQQITVRIQKKTNKIEKLRYFLVRLQRIFGEIVTCDVTPTSVLAFVSAVRSPSHFLLLGFTSAQLFLVFRSKYTMCSGSCTVGKNHVSFSMTIGNEELMHECIPKYLRMGTARMKQVREREEDKKRCVSTERSKAGTKKWSHKGLNYSIFPGVATPRNIGWIS